MKRLYRRVLDPVLALLRQGVTPEKIAISIGLGMILGVFPVLGATTLLCAGAALLLRLNLPAIQLVNFVMYPLQLGLLIPFIRLGERLFHQRPVELSLAQIVTKIHANAGQAIRDLWVISLHAVAAWFVVALPAVVVLYFLLLPLLRWLWRSQSLSMNNETAPDSNL